MDYRAVECMVAGVMSSCLHAFQFVRCFLDESWRQTVQRVRCTTVHHARQGWEPIRLKFENMAPVYVKSRGPKIDTKSGPNIFKKIVAK